MDDDTAHAFLVISSQRGVVVFAIGIMELATYRAISFFGSSKDGALGTQHIRSFWVEAVSS